MLCGKHFILYVADQRKSTDFYSVILGFKPRLDVPGMTEFDLGGDTILGLMPETGIKKLLGDKIKDPSAGREFPRAEIYLVMNDAPGAMARALEYNAKLLSPIQQRDWGHKAGYVQDLDGHILAFAEEVKER